MLFRSAQRDGAPARAYRHTRLRFGFVAKLLLDVHLRDAVRQLGRAPRAAHPADEATGLAELVGGDPRACRVLEAATELACRDLVRPRVGIVYASGFGEDLEQCQFLRRSAWRAGLWLSTR